jgi:hypothetical protein
VHSPLLGAARRESVYVTKVVDVPQAWIGLHARTVLLMSSAALSLLTADELQAIVAHEIGHEYVWADYERASSLADRARLQDLELVCDMVAILLLRDLEQDASPLLTSLEKMGRFNRERFGIAVNENNYPTLARRRAVARAFSRGLRPRR